MNWNCKLLNKKFSQRSIVVSFQLTLHGYATVSHQMLI